MQTVKRWFLRSLSLGLLLVTGAQAWGWPFVAVVTCNALIPRPQQEQPYRASLKGPSLGG